MGLVLERILFKQSYAFVHKKLSGKQLGFMGRRSVTTQLLHFLSDIYDKHDCDTAVYAFYLDFSIR